MIYLAGEMLICLVASAAIGFIVGWFLRGAGLKRTLRNIEKVYRINLASLKSKNDTSP
jgi:hypothetical protein